MFSDPIKNVEQLGIKPGSIVADFGSGSGHYTMAAAKVVGDTGRIYSIDIQKDIATKVKNEANKLGIFHVEAVWGDVEKVGGTKLRDSSVDYVIISNLMFQVDDKTSTAKEAFRILKPQGRLLFVDWSESFGGIGPHPESVFPQEKALELFPSAGFVLDHEIEAGSHHYGIIYKKP
jgi:ubiquinone/menaquinone biosynthesis C-methylase UbiE